MRIGVIGSEGFIGSHCVQYFLGKGHEIVGLDIYEQPSQHYRYIKVSRLSPELDDIFNEHAFDGLINVSGSGNVPYSMSHPVIDFEANSLDTIRTLDAIRKYQPQCKYIHFSSAAVYGNPARIPVNEQDTTVPLSPYGWHKLIAEHICREYTTIYKLRIAILRPFSVYGSGLKKQMFWDLLQKFKSVKNGMELLGTGNESRDYIHVSDLLHALNLVLTKGDYRADVYNVASGVEICIKDAVKYFWEALGEKPDYRFNGVVREGDPLNWRADITKLRQLGFTPKLDLQTGLEEMTSWMKSIYQ